MMPLRPCLHRPLTGLLCALAVVLTLLSVDTAPAAAQSKPESLKPSEHTVVYQARKAIDKKQYGAARKMLAAYVAKQTGKVHYLVHFTLANALTMEGDALAAIEHYRAAVLRYPDDAAVWQNMAKAYYDLEQYAAAGRSLVNAHALQKPPSASTAYQAAVAFILAKKPDLARPILEALVAGAPTTPEPEWLEALLKVYLDLDMGSKALDLTHGLLRKAGDRPQYWQVLARLHMDREAYPEAAAAMEIYMSLTPPELKKMRLLGDLYRMAQVPLKAAEQYEKVLGQAPNASDYEKAASAYIAAHRPEKAIDVLQAGTRHQATSRLLMMLAGIYYEKGLFEKAYQVLEQCLRSDPQNAAARLMMGYCALQLNRLKDAEAAFAQAARHPRQRAEANRMLAAIKNF